MYPLSSPFQIVFLFLGCAEFLMGGQLAGEILPTSFKIYVPLWQGLLVSDIQLLGSDRQKRMDVPFF